MKYHLPHFVTNALKLGHVESNQIISHHIITSHHHITSHHTISHHITSHYITSSHHIITSHHITSHFITSHHITSHPITSHHITSHHITSCKIRKDSENSVRVLLLYCARYKGTPHNLYTTSTRPHLMTLIAMERASEMLNISFSGTKATFLLAFVKSIDLIIEEYQEQSAVIRGK